MSSYSVDKRRVFRYNITVTNCDGLNGKIAAMVSGGIDSMVMLDMLGKSGADFFVVHVNHRIRAEADSDCAFVKNFCKAHGYEFVEYTFDIPSMAKISKRSVETEARLARRKVIDELLSAKRADKAALAHHADDNAETILMHILRGTGIDGLKGIEESDKIIRPLIGYTREEIKEYAARNGVEFVEDKTNFDAEYTRNFIRLEVLPLIKTRYPGAVNALNRLSQNASLTLKALDSMLDPSLISEDNDGVSLSLKAFDSPLAFRYIIMAAKRLMPVDVTRAQIENVMKLKDAQTGRKAELANGLKAYKDHDKIRFCFDEESEDFCIPFDTGTFFAGKKKLNVKSISPCVISGKTIVAAPVPDGCVFRRRKEGDMFTPFGGKRKTLKKYLIDKKIPSRIRDKLICLCCDSEVLAIVGVEISDKCRITSGTLSAYLLTEENI